MDKLLNLTYACFQDVTGDVQGSCEFLVLVCGLCAGYGKPNMSDPEASATRRGILEEYLKVVTRGLCR